MEANSIISIFINDVILCPPTTPTAQNHGVLGLEGGQLLLNGLKSGCIEPMQLLLRQVQEDAAKCTPLTHHVPTLGFLYPLYWLI